MVDSDQEAERNQGFHYPRRLGALILLVLKNALLNILTLTLYRFWAKTAVRRHLWNHTRFLGDPLEYTGVGKELFLGFLLVLFVVLLPLAVANQVLTRIFGPGSGLQIILLGFVLFLLGVARYRARRYRLSRTAWRGIRAAQTGAPWLYGLKSLGFTILLPLTLGWSYPWQRIHLMRFEISNTLFGDRTFRFDGGARPLYRRFAAAWALGMLAVGIVYLSLPVSYTEGFARGYMNSEGAYTGGLTPEALAVAGGILSALTISLVVLPFIVAWYRAREFKYFAASTKYEGLSFSFDGGTWSLIRLATGNFFIALLTLGFGLPFAQMRKFRYFCAHLKVLGEADFDAVRQSTEQRDKLGEGLADAFDIGDF